MLSTAVPPVVQLALTDAESERAHRSILANLPPDGLDPDLETVILGRIGAEALIGALSPEALAEVAGFPRSGSCLIVVRNLPQQERWPASPTSGWAAERDLSVVNALHLGMLQLMGIAPFAVGYENAGHLLRNVVPNPAAAGTTSSWGADQEFFWHTDNPHLGFGAPGCDPRRYVPRFLTFCGIRNEEQVPTDVMPLPYALEAMDEGLREDLGRAWYEVAAPDSVRPGEGGDRQALRSVPLLEPAGAEGGLPRIRFDRGTTTAAVPEAFDVLARFSDALEAAPYESLLLGAGDFLAFDNYRVLHRRVGFTPAGSGRERWLRRCYAG
ncbi:TauD/TfdA family dioxygenase [Streptomyces sp. NPDC086023]|uniref:TauD/TfdA family dioxygenase n=1 Tax=Streptomyces sp. NPDC086023 TaxID=3365746 RepID=UPI0037D210D0